MDSPQIANRVPEGLLASSERRPTWKRVEAAELFKRFFFLEESLTRLCAAWIPAAARLGSKAALARMCWESALTADALRTRVFELKYPSRLMQVGADKPLVDIFNVALHAPSARALFVALRTYIIPSLAEAYEGYLSVSDELVDGPGRRFIAQAVRDKRQHVEALAAITTDEPAPSSAQGNTDAVWTAQIRDLLASLGGVSLGSIPKHMTIPDILPSGKPYVLAQEPARDNRYYVCDFYWPDIIDPNYAYGEGLALQLRSAVSHINEVWAVETAAAILVGLADELGWEFVHDAARWLYDEARHMGMGKYRLDAWGLSSSEIPLGRYIYQACRDQDPIYRLGMLGYFETKNIGKKQQRAREFQRMGDKTSQMHMDFDWADETLHAEYGRRWLTALLERRSQPKSDWSQVLEICERLVQNRIAEATPEQSREIHEVAQHLLVRATQLAPSPP